MIRAVATVRFGPEDSPAEVPVLAGPGINEEWLALQPAAVSNTARPFWQAKGIKSSSSDGTSRPFWLTAVASPFPSIMSGSSTRAISHCDVLPS